MEENEKIQKRKELMEWLWKYTTIFGLFEEFIQKPLKKLWQKIKKKK